MPSFEWVANFSQSTLFFISLADGELPVLEMGSQVMYFLSFFQELLEALREDCQTFPVQEELAVVEQICAQQFKSQYVFA